MSTFIIDSTSVSDNRLAEGSAIEVAGGRSGIISGSTISDNRTSGFGGGIEIWSDGIATIVNSTVANNGASAGGAGVWVRGGDGVQVTNSTIANNDSIGVLGPAALHNTIVAGNLPRNALLFVDCGSLGGIPISLGHNLIGNPQGCGLLLSSDLTGDPGLTSFVDTGRPGGGVVRLRADSRAIDAGEPVMCPATDQQGLARPIDGNGDGLRACDIGAVEFYPVINDLVQVDSVQYEFRPPSPVPGQVNPLAAGGAFWIAAVFSNRGGVDICHVAFEVVTLKGAAGATPILLTERGEPIGGQGIILPAALAGPNEHLRAHTAERYQFVIGISQAEVITFFVNVRGEATAGPCDP
jgi:hypothetical protein